MLIQEGFAIPDVPSKYVAFCEPATDFARNVLSTIRVAIEELIHFPATSPNGSNLDLDSCLDRGVSRAIETFVLCPSSNLGVSALSSLSPGLLIQEGLPIPGCSFKYVRRCEPARDSRP